MSGSTDDGSRFNLGTPYGARREYSRIPAMVGPSGNLTTFHRTSDDLLGDRVTVETATHVLIHELTVLPIDRDGACRRP